ncbi:MAG TPA: FAD-binding oxidoreductase, partial [Aggregatilineales bacterium]|nr:FAD-binding oxidoreductase [Aggregatilineales bacterium]
MSTYATVSAQHVADLIAILDASRVSVTTADRDQHARDQSFHEPHLPDVVIWPETTEEVSRVLKFADSQRLPVVAWGAGTSLEGNPIAVFGGIVMNMGRMNRILHVHVEDFQVDVQPGVTRIELNKGLARHGLFFAPDPGADATIGGMVANNSSGIKTVRYGATKDNVTRLEVVRADGTVFHVGTRARKDSSGYDLLHLFIGSEGTLGIVTEATLKLAPLPAKYSAVLAGFSGIEPAMQTVVEIMGADLNPSALEFVDRETIAAISREKGLGVSEAPTIIMEFNGTDDNAGLLEAREICKENGAISFSEASGLEARNKLWEARHHTYETLVRAHPDQAQLIMDVAVPLSKYPEVVLFATDVLAEFGVIGYKFGHAGDGNLHINVLYRPDDPATIERARHVNETIVKRAIELGGTATGEHGVGIGKRKFMDQQHGAALGVMREIKNLFDPHGILNPGK